MMNKENKERLDNIVLIPELWEDDDGFGFYQFAYFTDFDDKVYHAKAEDSFSKSILKNWDDIRKRETPYLKNLAGDLSEEYNNPNPSHDEIKEFMCEHLSNIFMRKVVDISFYHKELGSNSLWVNYQKKNEHNPSHNHSGLYSFVWYLDIPEEIRNECYEQESNSRSRGLIQFFSSRTDDLMALNPKTNDFFIFNASQIHQVYPFYSDNTRVSMAGNIHLIVFEDGEILS